MTPADDMFGTILTTYKDIWLQCFIFSLISSLFVHIIASAVAFGRLRKHQWGRFLPILIIVMGIISPLTFGVLTSAAIAGIYVAADFKMASIYAVVWGCAQTVVLVFVSYTRFLFTL